LSVRWQTKPRNFLTRREWSSEQPDEPFVIDAITGPCTGSLARARPASATLRDNIVRQDAPAAIQGVDDKPSDDSIAPKWRLQKFRKQPTYTKSPLQAWHDGG
jgi:hypothetical protein